MEWKYFFWLNILKIPYCVWYLRCCLYSWQNSSNRSKVIAWAKNCPRNSFNQSSTEMRYSRLLFDHYVTNNRKQIPDQAPLITANTTFVACLRSRFGKAHVSTAFWSKFWEKNTLGICHSMHSLRFLSLGFIYCSICFSKNPKKPQIIQHSQNLSWHKKK